MQEIEEMKLTTLILTTNTIITTNSIDLIVKILQQELRILLEELMTFKEELKFRHEEIEIVFTKFLSVLLMLNMPELMLTFILICMVQN